MCTSLCCRWGVTVLFYSQCHTQCSKSVKLVTSTEYTVILFQHELSLTVRLTIRIT
jgi:hypothetical protein